MLCWWETAKAEIIDDKKNDQFVVPAKTTKGGDDSKDKPQIPDFDGNINDADNTAGLFGATEGLDNVFGADSTNPLGDGEKSTEKGDLCSLLWPFFNFISKTQPTN